MFKLQRKEESYPLNRVVLDVLAKHLHFLQSAFLPQRRPFGSMRHQLDCFLYSVADLSLTRGDRPRTYQKGLLTAC